MKTIIEKEVFGIVAMTILLIPQIAHTVYVFEANSHYALPWFSWCYAVGVDLAILIFTVRGWLRTAFIYLFATLAHNLAYQFMPEGMLSSILISVVQSATIYSFCHLFFKKSDPEEKEEEPLKTHMEIQEETLELQHALLSGVRFIAHPFLCPVCDAAFGQEQNLENHIEQHKKMQDWEPEPVEGWQMENDLRFNYCKSLEAHWNIKV